MTSESVPYIATSSRCLSSSPAACLEHSSATATYGATRSGNEEGPERGPQGAVAVGARRLIGRSESWLSQVERGKRGVDRRGGGDGEEGQRVYESAVEIERATMG
jgi:hypothetical protein